jgi:hypothetical protein
LSKYCVVPEITVIERSSSIVSAGVRVGAGARAGTGVVFSPLMRTVDPDTSVVSATTVPSIVVGCPKLSVEDPTTYSYSFAMAVARMPLNVKACVVPSCRVFVCPSTTAIVSPASLIDIVDTSKPDPIVMGAPPGSNSLPPIVVGICTVELLPPIITTGCPLVSRNILVALAPSPRIAVSPPGLSVIVSITTLVTTTGLSVSPLSPTVMIGGAIATGGGVILGSSPLPDVNLRRGVAAAPVVAEPSSSPKPVAVLSKCGLNILVDFRFEEYGESASGSGVGLGCAMVRFTKPVVVNSMRINIEVSKAGVLGRIWEPRATGVEASSKPSTETSR